MVDRLTQDCIAAEKAGMSYGKWKALHYSPVEVAIPKQEEPEVLEVAPKEVRVCRICGKVIPRSKHKLVMYCSQWCREEANRRSANAYYHRKKERMMGNEQV